MAQQYFTITADGVYRSADGSKNYQFYTGDQIPMELAVELGIEGAALREPPFFSSEERAAVETIATGRTRLGLYDDFSRYPDGAISGEAAQLGGVWSVTGAGAPIIADGKLIASASGASGYAVQTFDERPVAAYADVVFSGTDATIKPMTLAWCRTDDGDMLDHMVHLNLGPEGFVLALRKDAGDFESALTGAWWADVPLDETTVARFGLVVDGENAIVYGPNGETFGVRDRRIPLILAGGGNTVFWEPGYGDDYGASVLTASAMTARDSGETAPPVQPHELAVIGVMVGSDGRTYGNRFGASSAWIGNNPATNMPALGLGAAEIHATLLTATEIGATTFAVTEKSPEGSAVVLGIGDEQETLTQNSSVASGTNPPYTITTTGAATKAHAAGEAVTITPPSSQRVTLGLNTQNGHVTLPDALMIIPNTQGLYFGTGLDTRLFRAAANILAMPTGDSFQLEGGTIKLKPIALPATCAVGDICLDTADNKLKLCTATNTWTVVGAQS